MLGCVNIEKLKFTLKNIKNRKIGSGILPGIPRRKGFFTNNCKQKLILFDVFYITVSFCPL